MAASRLTDTFLVAAHAMSQRLNMSMPDLLVTSASEAGLDPAAHNPGGATGLIQIVDLPRVGWTDGWQAFAKLTPEEQLPYIERYFAPYKGAHLDTHQRIHQALFVPATLGEGSAPDLVLVRSDGTRWPNKQGVPQEPAYYKENAAALDREKKGYITVEDLRRFDMRASGNAILKDAYARIPTLIPELAPRVESLLAEFRTAPKLLPQAVPATPLNPFTPPGTTPSKAFPTLVALSAMGLATWLVLRKKA